MPRLCLLFFVLSLTGQTAVAETIPEEQTQVRRARQILDSWQEQHAVPVERILHIISWTPADRDFPADSQARLSRMLKHVQLFYANEMERHGFGRRSFNLDLDGHGLVRVHQVRGQNPEKHYGNPSGDEIRNECLKVLGKEFDPDQETFAIFCNLANWDQEKLVFTHHSPYYAGGNFRRGTAWQIDSPELDTINLPLTSPMIDDGEYGRISLGKHNSIFIGGIAHELGHAFGLPHCAARPDEAIRGSGLMGGGNRTYGDELRDEGQGTFLTLANALRLASHPQFSGRLERQTNQVELEAIGIDIAEDRKAMTVSGVIRGNPPIYAIVAYFDPEGGGDYDATTATAIPDEDGRFTMRTSAITAGKAGELRLVPLHANGAIASSSILAPLRFGYDVAADGSPDLTAIQTRLKLSPVVAALAANERSTAAELALGIRAEPAARVAHLLMHPKPRATTPAAFSGDAATVSLTDFKPDSAEVGWRSPTYDQIPDSSPLLEAGGIIHLTGIYAHAPAKHLYALGGRWKALKGKAALADGHEGSVQFEIRGNGSPLWTSEIVRGGTIVEFTVPLEGVQTLELTTSTGDDGPGEDWALWLDPQLIGEETGE